MCQGKGIFLTRNCDWVVQGEHYVAQRYLHKPYLIDGLKFDLRIYVLVTCYQPLTVYLYRDGFGRFTNSRYSNNLDDLSNTYMHLTNVAIQKTSDAYNEQIGGKWDLRGMKLFLMSRYGNEKVNEAY